MLHVRAPWTIDETLKEFDGIFKQSQDSLFNFVKKKKQFFLDLVIAFPIQRRHRVFSFSVCVFFSLLKQLSRSKKRKQTQRLITRHVMNKEHAKRKKFREIHTERSKGNLSIELFLSREINYARMNSEVDIGRLIETSLHDQDR